MNNELSSRSNGMWAKLTWLSALVLFIAAPSYSATSDEEAIRALVATQQAAWDAHDAHAYAALFAPDATLVTSRGEILHGGEIVSRMARDFTTIFAPSQMRVGDVSVRRLGADFALARVSWSISGVRSSRGGTLPAYQIVETQLLVRTAKSWRITELQDTVVLDSDRASPAQAMAIAPDAAARSAIQPSRRCVVGRGNGDCLIYGKTSVPTGDRGPR